MTALSGHFKGNAEITAKLKLCQKLLCKNKNYKHRESA